MGDRSVGIAGNEGSGAAPDGYRSALAEFAAARNWALDGQGRPGRDIQGDTILLDVVRAENPRSGASQWGFAAFRASGADEGRECVRLDIKEAVEGMMMRLRAERVAGPALETQSEPAPSSFGR